MRDDQDQGLVFQHFLGAAVPAIRGGDDQPLAENDSDGEQASKEAPQPN